MHPRQTLVLTHPTCEYRSCINIDMHIVDIAFTMPHTTHVADQVDQTNTLAR